MRLRLLGVGRYGAAHRRHSVDPSYGLYLIPLDSASACEHERTGGQESVAIGHRVRDRAAEKDDRQG